MLLPKLHDQVELQKINSHQLYCNSPFIAEVDSRMAYHLPHAIA